MAGTLVSIAIEKLIDVIGQQLSLFADATHELQKLSSTFLSIQAVLADAESRQVGEQNVKLWLSRLRRVAYDIEDLLEDERISGVGDQEGNEDDGNRRKKARLLFGFAYNLFDYSRSRLKVANDIKEIKKTLDQIDVERNRFGFSSSPPGGDHSMLLRSQRLTTSLIDESEIIGREDDKETMISRLVCGCGSNEDRGQVQVVAIAGIGGLGKTTLARILYHDAKVRGHFNQAVYWVCVSEPFDVTRLTKEIIEEVKREPPTLSALNALQDELLQSLRGKRFLLVLDDVWNDDADKWKMLRLSLTSGANGSRILVTTRSEKVAKTMNANYIHKLKGLSDDQSWTLFSGRAFRGRREGDCSEFESIGKEIVNKCKGVPLSIKVIGSAMKTKRTIEDWKNVLESKIWSLPQATDKILPALLLTYCHLPPRLKQCFVYCSMFPKDWNFKKDMLIKLWVAQGFILSEGNREKEDIASEYFDELVARSMFQEIQGENEGNIRCKMHDLLHDLAKFIAEDEIYTFTSNSKGEKSEECSGSSGDVRHAFLSLACIDDKPNKIPIDDCRAKKLRTLWLDETVGGGIDKLDSDIIDLINKARFLRALYFLSSTTLPKSIGELKHLRYLHLPFSEIVKLPDTIGKIQQLRYLDLSWNSNIVELPESVSNLCNLHTFELSVCRKLKKLPRGIGGMVGLRYLNLSHNSNMVELPESMGDLHNLHTLKLSNCGKLEKLPRGIGGMVNLRDLDLSHNSNMVELPESVGDLRNLHTLNLSHCGKLEKLPRGIGGMVNLRDLDLSWHSNMVELPESVGELRSLHTLNLSWCEKLEKLPRGIGGMISLRHLKIEETESLKYLPKGLGRISGLRSLCKFIVGGGDEAEGCGIEELQRLNSLQGALEIEHLERVAKREEAEKAELWKKQHLRYLDLNMSVERDDDAEAGMIDSVLECLRPHENLEELTLYGCTGSKLPSWMDRMRCLQKLVLDSGPKLERVPHLPSLREFHINGARNEIFPDEGWEQLMALQELMFKDWKELRCLPEGLTQLPSLEELHINGCNKLESLPDSLGQLESLKSLSIWSCEKLESLPDSLRQLKKLKSLSVVGSKVLRCLPDSVGQLESLESLHIYSCEKLESLPDSLGQLESLESLNISWCEKLESLPDSLGQLKALRRLKIQDCKALASLPQGLRHLSLLQTLSVYRCPLLWERCKREGGVDWPNISHIPNIDIRS